MTTNSRSPAIRPIQAQILRSLRGSPHREFSEYELIRELQKHQLLPITPETFTQTLSLFQIHFLVFHCLYDLRDRLRVKRLGQLEISPLRISLDAYKSQKCGLEETDPLRQYYLDLDNLVSTCIEEIDAALSEFWSRMINKGSYSSSELKKALSVLELEEPVTLEEIKQHYRRLAMRHHPDRGGCNERLKEINGAMRILSASWNSN